MGRTFENRKASMAKTAARKTKIYSKYGRELYVVAKAGGADPNGNLALRGLIERAKRDQVPSHIIDKALEKASGGVGEDYAPARYEGFGPGGTSVIVDCLTDNPTRTVGEVRNCFTKSKCKLGTPGTVAHLFDHVAVFVFAGTEEAAFEALLGADVDVGEIEAEEGKLTIFVPPTEYGNAKQVILDTFGEIEFDVDEIRFVSKGSIKIEGDDVATMDKLLEMLDDCDDVQNVYHDAEYPAG
ncbi:MAG: YebC/PmpR family DNA-binding transcriptional regulator [Deltaproteobacteria bacterium]|nr:YebC/PmpR family DNA-binding transcriptional regulator [Deltaproteobacteria bacterium]